MLEPVAAAMLQARASLRAEYAKLHRMLLRIVRADAVCRRFMTAPGIGAVVAVSYRTAVDDPTRFHKSRDLGPYFGLTPSKYQSGEVDRTGEGLLLSCGALGIRPDQADIDIPKDNRR
jgi:transposase